MIFQLPALLPSLHQHGLSDWRVINSYNRKSEFLSIRLGTGKWGVGATDVSLQLSYQEFIIWFNHTTEQSIDSDQLIIQIDK